MGQTEGASDLHIGWAMNAIRCGEFVTRKEWESDTFLYYVETYHINPINGAIGWMPDMEAFIAMKTARYTSVPWVPSQRDVLATDWERSTVKTKGVES